MSLSPKDKKGLFDIALGSDKGHLDAHQAYGSLTVEKKTEPTPVPKGLDVELPEDGEETSAIGQVVKIRNGSWMSGAKLGIMSLIPGSGFGKRFGFCMFRSALCGDED
ncbi:hypothetical protein U1Q18_003266 [Sarracenia purpurea var. burkii]